MQDLHTTWTFEMSMNSSLSMIPPCCRVEQVVRHRAYGKTMRRSSKLAAHDETNDAHVGDTVRVVETRPLSKTKRWRVVQIVERAK